MHGKRSSFLRTSPASDFSRDISVDEDLNLNPLGSIKYYLDFIPNAAQISIITNSGVFPKPAGVQLILTYL